MLDFNVKVIQLSTKRKYTKIQNSKFLELSTIKK